MRTITCTTCKEDITLPQAAVRLREILRCDKGHLTQYDVKHYYEQSGKLKAA